jgi:hypothetical protein
MVRRLVWVALAAGAACSDVTKLPSGPTDSFYRPTGVGVYAGKLVVASSNSDLLYDSSTGGSVITVDPAAGADPARPLLVSGINIESFAGQVAIADPADPRGAAFHCPTVGALASGALALVPVRGADQVYAVGLGSGGALSCAGCGMSLGGAQYADAYSVGIACAPATSSSPAMARGYVGYLRGQSAHAWMTELDLTTSPPTPRSGDFGVGQMRGFAFDPVRRRLYAVQAPQGVRWLDLTGTCLFGAAEVDGGCRGGAVAMPPGLEARAIALSRPDAPGAPRLYVLARVYDGAAAGYAGVRAGDVDGQLLVMEPFDDLAGQTQLHLVRPPVSVGYGPVALATLPGRAGRRDVLAALTLDDPVLVLFDDDTGASVVIGRDDVYDPVANPTPTGHPWIGSAPFGLAVDPVPTAGGDAHVYVGSFQENFVTQIDVPLADIELTRIPASAAAPYRHIRGGTP